jgi:hypothetical protein
MLASPLLLCFLTPFSRAYTTDHFETLLSQAAVLMADDRFALLIVDSIMEVLHRLLYLY